jgi:hypothetical protein
VVLFLVNQISIMASFLRGAINRMCGQEFWNSWTPLLIYIHILELKKLLHSHLLATGRILGEIGEIFAFALRFCIEWR